MERANLGFLSRPQPRRQIAIDAILQAENVFAVSSDQYDAKARSTGLRRSATRRTFGM
jgi:hypothetical protein